MVEALLFNIDPNNWGDSVLYDGVVDFEEYSNQWWSHLYSYITDDFLRQERKGNAHPGYLKNGRVIGAMSIPKITAAGVRYSNRFEFALKGDHRDLEPREVWIGSLHGLVVNMNYQTVFKDDPSSEITQWFIDMDGETPMGGTHRVRILL